MPAFNSMAGFITAGPDEASRPAVRFLVALGRALHESGVSAHRIEETLLLAADRLGVLLHVFTLPTGMFLSFGERENAASSAALPNDSRAIETFIAQNMHNDVEMAA